MNLGESNIRKYLICHEAEYTESDDSCLVELPVSPILPLHGKGHLVSLYSFENLEATMVERLIADKLDVEIELKCIGEDNLTNVRAAINKKIRQYGTRNFYFNFWHPLWGWYFSHVYFGSDPEATTEYLSTTDGSDTVTHLKFTFIEVEGTKLNQ